MFSDDNVKDVQSVLFQVQWQTRLHIWLQGAGKIWNCCGKSDYCSKEDCQDMNIWKSGNNVLFLCFASICCLEILLCTLWFGINHQLNKIIQLFIDVAKQYRSQYSGLVVPLAMFIIFPHFHICLCSSTLLCYISLLSGLWNDRHQYPMSNTKII